jgi:hypothetical protein
MQINCKQQYWKHDSLIRINFDSDSNVILSMWLGVPEVPAKLDLPRISTERGMQIDCNEQCWKHDFLIRLNLDSDSNVIDCRSEWLKLDLRRTSTERGMQIDRSEQNWKHDSSIRINCESGSNVIASIRA